MESKWLFFFFFLNLFGGDVLKVLARHDASEFCFNKALCPLSLWRPAKDNVSWNSQHLLKTAAPKESEPISTKFKLDRVYWLVDKHGGWVWSCGLQVLHGVPLVDAALVWSNAALIVAHPGESHSSREIVIPAWNLTCFVQNLQGWPRWLLNRKIKNW